MGFFDHADELRSRFTRSLVVFLAGFGLCYLWSERILDVLRRPLFQALPPEARKLYFTGLFENFLVHLKVSGYASLALFSPYFVFQIWAFVSPGLYPKERKLVIPVAVATALFFLAGASFAYFGLFPIGFKYFVSYGGPNDTPLLTMDSYYSTCLKLMALFGIAFELPVITTVLGVLGVIDGDTLRAHRKSAILAITVVSALVAPPDAVSMLMLMAPLILMYEGSTLVVSKIVKRRARTANPTEHPWAGQSS